MICIYWYMMIYLEDTQEPYFAMYQTLCLDKSDKNNPGFDCLWITPPVQSNSFSSAQRSWVLHFPKWKVER